MTFFGVGPMEVVVIMIIALLILGPGRLPEVMGEAGRSIRQFRRMSRELTGDFQDSISDVRQTFGEVQSDLDTTVREVRRETESISTSVASTINETVSDSDVDSEAKPQEGASRPVSRGPGIPERSPSQQTQQPAAARLASSDKSHDEVTASREDPLADLDVFDDDFLSPNGSSSA